MTESSASPVVIRMAATELTAGWIDGARAPAARRLVRVPTRDVSRADHQSRTSPTAEVDGFDRAPTVTRPPTAVSQRQNRRVTDRTPKVKVRRVRSFDPNRVGHWEWRAWVAYYRRDWPMVLISSVGLVHASFGMGWARTLRGAWLVLRANQLWAPYSETILTGHGDAWSGSTASWRPPRASGWTP